jgi:hypothetical protein
MKTNSAVMRALDSVYRSRSTDPYNRLASWLFTTAISIQDAILRIRHELSQRVSKQALNRVEPGSRVRVNGSGDGVSARPLRWNVVVT